MFAKPIGYTNGEACNWRCVLGFRGEILPDEDLKEVTCGWQYFKSRDRMSRDGKGRGPRGAQDKDSYRRGAPRISERGWGGGESKTREQEAVHVGSEGSAPGMRACADGRSGRRRPELRTSRQTWEQDDHHRYTCGSLVRMEGESLSRLGSRESSRGSETGRTFYPKEKQF